ncbi:hypothetical protein HOLleu_17994 [Holothuria leucospilota]|uniref:IgGFc-binding protein N-terminal domain-containing protein n=1 Tax=Holothuria leucospilota TaxID=206669 RepID=A0A9Q1H8R4_HOLLE|nr:hypothetical protein HOLleu_17994 [Holothuria leucospilota]
MRSHQWTKAVALYQFQVRPHIRMERVAQEKLYKAIQNITNVIGEQRSLWIGLERNQTSTNLFKWLNDQNFSTSDSLSSGRGEFFNISRLILPSESGGTGSRREKSTVVVDATSEVSVYGHVRCTAKGSKRSSAFKVKGIAELGKAYRVMTFRNIGYSQIAVVAIENETLVQVVNKKDSTKNVTITLQMYETYIIEDRCDMTGTYIEAMAKIFVLAGNGAERSPQRDAGRDSFHATLTPYSQWGTKHYFFSPFKMTSWTAIKLISWENDNVTVVQWKNGTQATSSPSESRTTFETSKDLGKIESPKPILAAQFSEPKISIEQEETAGALSMFLISSLSQFTRKYTVFPVFDIDYVDHEATYYINVVLPLDGRTTDLYVNNKTSGWQFVGNYSDGSTVVRHQLLPGANLLENRGRFNITAVVSASQLKRCYTFALS